MVLLPGPPRQGLAGRRLLEGVVQPTMPVRRDLGSVCIAFVDDEATVVAVVVVALVHGLEISIAGFILAHEPAASTNLQPRPDGGPCPPGEDRSQHFVRTGPFERPAGATARG